MEDNPLLAALRPSAQMVTDTLARRKRPLRYAMGLVYVVAGVLHFVTPRQFEEIVPPRLPRPRALVYLSGVAELVLGVGVLFERTRERSAWGLVALLAAVFPANVYMASDEKFLRLAPEGARDAFQLALYARLPLQAVLVAWAWWHTTEDGTAD